MSKKESIGIQINGEEIPVMKELLDVILSSPASDRVKLKALKIVTQYRPAPVHISNCHIDMGKGEKP